ncbi:31 kDa ribonucleoprotein, chloroplastic [Momordica charantia]|uniref:31 kDa ribonucleoprotein, chloroplastic n=1 Tax=Momordica charantia TaxID=3673 RepID=A0A6J1E4S9_MOMCH|nr:31 kDa ribonucleoprotein, chloroplastic [Momordica charantia]
MALLRLPCSSSSSFIRSKQRHPIFLASLSCPQNPSHSIHGDIHLSLSTSLTHHPSISIRAKRTSKSIFQFVSASHDETVARVPSESEGPKIGADEFSRTRLLAQNVPWNSTPEDIRSLFEKYGTVLDVELSMYNKIRNRGLAFVTMGSPEEALTALNNLESYEYEGRTLRLNYAKIKKEKPYPPPVKPKPVTFNLFVANLPYDARAKDLKEFFDSGSGNVVSAQVIFNENPRRSSGYGFVAFKTKKDAEAAISDFQGKIFMGRTLRVARSKQFAKLPSEDKSQSEVTSTDVSVELANAAAQV